MLVFSLSICASVIPSVTNSSDILVLLLSLYFTKVLANLLNKDLGQSTLTQPFFPIMIAKLFSLSNYKSNIFITSSLLKSQHSTLRVSITIAKNMTMLGARMTL